MTAPHIQRFETRVLAQAAMQVDDAGVFEGYIAIWDDVDSYRTRFQRGAFKKTFRERLSKIKLIWSHDTQQLIGKLLEAREDDVGAWIRGKLTLEVAKAAEARALMLDKVLNELSFGFDTIQSKPGEDGIRVITEVRLYEVSPVGFPSNENAKITAVRDVAFGVTLDALQMAGGGQQLLQALYQTLDDLSYQRVDIAAYDAALETFHAAYLAWVTQMRDTRETGDLLCLEHANALAGAVRSHLGERTVADVAATTSLTADELTQLRTGKLISISARSKLVELSPGVVAAHAAMRSERIAELCAELRTGVTPAEAVRISALLPTTTLVAPDESRAGGGGQARLLADLNKLLETY